MTVWLVLKAAKERWVADGCRPGLRGGGWGAVSGLLGT